MILKYSNRRMLFVGVGALALCSTLAVAQNAPESLLPPGFDDPAPAPSPAPRPSPTATRAAPVTPTTPSQPNAPTVQPLPSDNGSPAAASGASLPSGLPSLEELDRLGEDELDELLGLKPKFDIPPAARRSLSEVGVLAPAEGGLPTASLAKQPASIVRAALSGTRKPMVSRWGHILLRRGLASRLTAPDGMNPVEFAALRAAALNRIGEHGAARSLVQDVDTGNWNKGLTDAALNAYIGTSDIVGACPVVQLQGRDRDDAEWRMLQAICKAFAGQDARANSDLNRALSDKVAPEIDVLLAQRYAGAAGRGRRAVTLEWEDVDGMTPWRFALANAVGAEIPAELLETTGAYYERASATAPMLPLPRRASGADRAAREGILSAAAMVDLYSQIYAADGIAAPLAQTASLLRDAYVADDPAARLAAMQSIWGEGASRDYGRVAMTAYAAARMPVSSDFADQAAPLIASMLTAGLDQNALAWASVVPQGSEAWALLALAQPSRANPVDEGLFASFADNDESAEQQKSKFLLAGLAGLQRLEASATRTLAGDLSVDLARETKWSRLISGAAEVQNQALVVYLAGVGMQGESWDQMTPRHLYHIVSALDRVGLSAEARMIAAEAVARG